MVHIVPQITVYAWETVSSVCVAGFTWALTKITRVSFGSINGNICVSLIHACRTIVKTLKIPEIYPGSHGWPVAVKAYFISSEIASVAWELAKEINFGALFELVNQIVVPCVGVDFPWVKHNVLSRVCQILENYLDKFWLLLLRFKWICYCYFVESSICTTSQTLFVCSSNTDTAVWVFIEGCWNFNSLINIDLKPLVDFVAFRSIR